MFTKNYSYIITRSYHSNGKKHRHLLSKLFQPYQEFISVSKSAKKDEDTCKSHRLLVDFGLIRPCQHSTYAYLPLAMRSLEKLNKLIDDHMENIQAQKILLPTMTDAKLWKKSGRLNKIQDELFRLKNRHDHELVLGPTYEEAITNLVASLGMVSYKSMPIRLYQACYFIYFFENSNRFFFIFIEATPGHCWPTTGWLFKKTAIWRLGIVIKNDTQGRQNELFSGEA